MSKLMRIHREVPQEPLKESAPLARLWAAQHCTDCGWYHGFWQDMRLMGLGKTLSGQGSYFLERVGKCHELAAPRVLISGCADYSALAYVVAGLGRGRFDAADPPQVVVLDRCETPLQLSRWYAQRLGLPAQNVQTIRTDILNFKSTARFDLILTSSFVGYFDPPRRARLFERYADLLAPSGKLVFANRLRDLPEEQAIGFGESEVAAFLSRARLANSALAPQDQLIDEYLEQSVQAYGQHFKSYPVASEASLLNSLAQAGLKVIICQSVRATRTQNAGAQELAGPTLADGSNYVVVEAGKI